MAHLREENWEKIIIVKQLAETKLTLNPQIW